MVSSTWLLVIAATAIPSVSCKSGKDLWAQVGEDWRFLDGFLDWAKEKGYKSDATGALESRAQGTFWHVQKAKSTPDRWVDEKACGISFYYPTMSARQKDKSSKLNPNITWGVPFAAAPWCRERDPVPMPDDYPGYDTKQEGNHSVVFHQLYGGNGWKDDCYMMLT